MSNRKAIAFMAFILFVESLAQALKHPMLMRLCYDINAISPLAAELIQAYYTSAAVWIRLVLYAMFTMYVVNYNSMHAQYRFGRYFIYDFGVLFANVLYLTFMPENRIIRLTTKLVLEMANITTSLFIAHYIYKDIKKTACFTYAEDTE